MAKKVKLEFLPEKATEAQMNAFERNYASDFEIAQRFMAQVKGNVQDARNNRLTLEDKWIDDIRLWSCVLDNLGYQGRSQIFVPELHNQIEQGVEKDIMSIFPSMDMFNAIPINGTPTEKADKIQAAVQYELAEKVKIYIKHIEFERQKRLLGTSVYKAGFKKEMLDVFWRDEKGRPLKQQIPKYHGVDWQVVDLFRFYIYPETSNLENCKIVFEDQLANRDDLINSGLYVNVDSIQASSIDMNHQWSDVEQLNIVSLATAIASRPNTVFLTEIWTDFKLNGKIVPVVGTVANNATLIRLTRNPFWFQRHPYLAEVYEKRLGKIFYGFSMPDKIRGQQYQMNDLTNHTMDSLTYTLNPITAIDPALAGDVNSMKVMPGAKWLGSPEGIKMLAFPDVSQSGLRAMQEVRGQIAQFSDNSPGIAPQLQGKARSATQASIIQQNVSARQRMLAKSEEHSVLAPMCQMTHTLLVQYMEQEWQIKYQGADAGEWIVDTIKPGDLVGEVDWVWKGASAQEMTAVRSQQLLAFFKEALQVAALQPGEVDLALLFKRIAREAFDIKDLDNVFKSLRDKKTIDPEVENIALYDGEDIPIHNGDDDDFHMERHDMVIEDEDAPPEAKLAALKHKEKHQAQKAAKQRVLELKSRLDILKQMNPEGAQEGGPQPGGPQAPPSPMEGNIGQMSSSANVMSGVKGSENI